MKRVPLALAGALIFVSVFALPAQAGEIFGSVGYGRFSGEDNGFFGPVYSAGIGAHPLPLLGFELTYHGMQHKRESFASDTRTGGTPLFFSGNVLLHLSGGVIQPYVVGGLGLLHFEGTDRGNENEFAMNFGAGMKIFVVPKISLRPELRYFTTLRNTIQLGRPPNPTYKFNMIEASIGVSLHW